MELEYTKALAHSTKELQLELEELMLTIKAGIDSDLPTKHLIELNNRVSGLNAVIGVQVKMLQRMVKDEL